MDVQKCVVVLCHWSTIYPRSHTACHRLTHAVYFRQPETQELCPKIINNQFTITIKLFSVSSKQKLQLTIDER
jgi:hypothetical protein